MVISPTGLRSACPNERRLKRACNRSAAVTLYTYGSRAAQIWWQQNQPLLAKQQNLNVYFVDDDLALALASAPSAITELADDGE